MCTCTHLHSLPIDIFTHLPIMQALIFEWGAARLAIKHAPQPTPKRARRTKCLRQCLTMHSATRAFQSPPLRNATPIVKTPFKF